MAAVAVLVGLIAMSLQSRAAGLWLVAFAVGSVVVFRDAYIELFDAGQLLNTIAHSEDVHLRKHLAALSVPFYLFVDGLVLVGSYIIYSWAMRQNADFQSARVELLLRVIPVFLFLVALRTYRTLWSRALALDFLRLLLACVLGSVVGSVAVYYSSADAGHYLKTVTLEYALLSFVGLLAVRTMRGLVRDIFYAIDCSRLKNRKDVSRVLVYGGGLRYRAFRRELVRTTASNNRIIVGILDDDMLMRGRYIGGVKIYGTINEAKSVICATNADAVVIACEVSESWLNVVKQILEPTGVKVTRFTFSETAL
jgi:FlaA1/EpsC-like NDP-sugar epimerase